MQRDTRGMQEYIRQLYVSASTLDIIATVTIVILLTSFFEKVLGINFVGRRILNGIWIVICFIFKRVLSIFKPEIDKIKPGFDLLKKFAVNSSEVEEQLASLLSIKRDRASQISEINIGIQSLVKSVERQDEAILTIGEQVHSMNYELRTNGGESVKDTIIEVRVMLNASVRDRSLIKQHLEIEDKLSDRMMFKIDEAGRCSFISNAFLKFFGWSESDMIGDNWIFCIDDRDVAIVEIKWDMAFKSVSRYYNKQHIKDSVGCSHYCLVIAYPIVVNDELVGFRGVVEVIKESDNEFIPPKPLKIYGE